MKITVLLTYILGAGAVVGGGYGIYYASQGSSTSANAATTPAVPKATEQSPSSSTTTTDSGQGAGGGASGSGQGAGGGGAGATGGSGQGAGANPPSSITTDEKKGTGPTACATHTSTAKTDWWNSWRDFM